MRIDYSVLKRRLDLNEIIALVALAMLILAEVLLITSGYKPYLVSTKFAHTVFIFGIAWSAFDFAVRRFQLNWWKNN